MKPKIDKIEKPRKSGGIKWKIFRWLLIFAAVILVILWLCQVVFLDNIYKAVKIAEIKSAASDLAEYTDTAEELNARAEELCSSSDICVFVMKMLNNQTALGLASVDTQRDCTLHNTDQRSKFVLYDSAKKAGGSNLQRFYFDDKSDRFYSIEGSLYDKNPSGEADYSSESILYTVITEAGDGSETVIFIDAVISPVGATVRTLNFILIIISGILILLSAVVAFVISYRVSKPLEKMSYAANELAKGDYSVAFSGSGYRETEELASSLNYAASELSKVDSLRRELIANISHDLRTPLTMIEGYSEVMRDLPGENTPENVQIIIDETNRLSSLVNDVLDISRLEDGSYKPKNERFNLTEAVRTTLLRYNKLCERNGYRIEFAGDSDVFVNSDQTRIMQVIYNLINNAVTYTGEDKTVYVRQSVRNGAAVRIEVEDSGDGIAPDKLEFIWERYYKVDKEHKRAAIGTGLGLSIVKRTMEMLGGSCGVISAVGHGSIFWIELPTDDGDTGRNDL